MSRAAPPRSGTSADVGLCAACRYAIEQRNARGSCFTRCGLADSDPGFNRYPPLPVVECSGFAPNSAR